MALTQDRLKEQISYDPDTGIFTWRVHAGSVRAGQVAGGISVTKGYRDIGVDGHLYCASRLAWLYMTGCWPAVEIDHFNQDKKDNSWSNLREATLSQNRANVKSRRDNTSGVKGVSKDKHGKWKAQICVNKKHIYLGLFTTLSEAAEAYRLAAETAFGEFAA